MTDKKVLIFVLSGMMLLISTCLPAHGAAPDKVSESLYESRLDKGLFNTEPYSYLLINKAHEDKSRAKEFLELAKIYSPDLPAVYFELAKENISLSPTGIFKCIDYFMQGIKAYFRSFWWGFSFAGVMYISLILSLILSLVIVLAIRLPLDAGLFLHDVTEDKRRLSLAGIVVLLSLFGTVGFITGVFILISFNIMKKNRIVVYVSILFFFLSPLFLGLVGVFLSSPSPALRSIAAVNEGKDNRYAIENLKMEAGFDSLFSYALALKREGYYKEAIEIYLGIITHSTEIDPRVYVNLGNAYHSTGNPKAAEEAYKKSIDIKPLPSALYNLSQISRERLDFVKGEEYFNEATRLDPGSVSRYAALAGQGPNRLVVDEMLDGSDIWEYAINKTGIFSSLSWLLNTALKGIILTIFYLFSNSMKSHAKRCRRCGAVFCDKCSETKTRHDTCPRCYASLVKIDKLNLKERIATFLLVQKRQAAKIKLARMLSYFVPGAGHIYAGEMLSGFILLWPFLFSVTVLVMYRLSFPGLAPFTHGWVVPGMVAVLGAVYFLSIFHMRKGINKGWL